MQSNRVKQLKNQLSDVLKQTDSVGSINGTMTIDEAMKLFDSFLTAVQADLMANHDEAVALHKIQRQAMKQRFEAMQKRTK